MSAAIAAILNFAMWVASLLGLGKPDPVAQGEKLGQAETTESDAMGELHDIQAAKVARDAVVSDPSGVMLDPNNAGPAKPI